MPETRVETILLPPNEPFPNNRTLPLVLYTLGTGKMSPHEFEDLFERHGWSPAWRYGVFPYHHYHSTAHEVLGCYAGEAEIQFGGPESKVVALSAGMAVTIPAGVAHCNLGSSSDFVCVGAYPPGQQWDLLRGNPGEIESALENIPQVPLPPADPILGNDGPVGPNWSDWPKTGE